MHRNPEIDWITVWIMADSWNWVEKMPLVLGRVCQLNNPVLRFCFRFFFWTSLIVKFTENSIMDCVPGSDRISLAYFRNWHTVIAHFFPWSVQVNFCTPRFSYYRWQIFIVTTSLINIIFLVCYFERHLSFKDPFYF